MKMVKELVPGKLGEVMVKLLKPLTTKIAYHAILSVISVM